jgi:hypothetical protein
MHVVTSQLGKKGMTDSRIYKRTLTGDVRVRDI